MKTFDTVAKLKLAKLKEGQFVETGGYYAKGGGGAARYLIVTPQAFDGYGDHELANGNVAVLQGAGTVDVKQFGAVGDGVTEDTGPFLAARDHIDAGTASIFYVPKPSSFYVVDLIKFTGAKYTIEHESRDTKVQLKPKDVTAITNTYVYQLDGGTPTVKNGLLDGNKANQINVGGSNNDHECLDLKSCIDAQVFNVHAINSVGDGIDLDSCTNATVQGCKAEGTGGYGIHNSLDSTGSRIWNNAVDNCGHDKLRGGIDAFKAVGTPALNGDYRGNIVSNCYRNYNIEFNDDTAKLKTHYFDASNLSLGTTVLDDVLTGARDNQYYSATPTTVFNRGFAATGCKITMPDANILTFNEFKESTSTDTVQLSIKILGGGGIDIPLASGGIDISPSSGTKWRFKRNGGDGFMEIMNDDSSSMIRTFFFDKTGDAGLTQSGKGIVLVSPNGLVTKKLTIDNAGALSILNYP